MSKLHLTAYEIISHLPLLMIVSMSLATYTLIVQINKLVTTITLNWIRNCKNFASTKAACQLYHRFLLQVIIKILSISQCLKLLLKGNKAKAGF